MPSALTGTQLRARARARDLQAAYASMEPALARRLQAADQVAIALECWLLRAEVAPDGVETIGAYEAMREALEGWQAAVLANRIARVAG